MNPIAELARLDRLGPALVAATGDTRWADVRADFMSGGQSNLTFALTSPAGELVLRRTPTGELLPSADDMVREARVQSALLHTNVPVPEIVLIDEGDLIGVPCYVMERVPGHVLRGHLPTGYAASADDRRALSFAFIDALAALHSIEPATAELTGFGRPWGFAERQVRRWTGQWERSRAHEVPELDELSRRLAARIPDQRVSSIVHGDYRLDNCVLDAHNPGRVNAVLDWELSTLGDPMTDLGYALLFWRHPGETPVSRLTPTVTVQPGFATRSDLVERYTAATDANLDELGFYLALAHFKFAVNVQSIANRSRSGTMGGQDFDDLDSEVLALASTALDLI